MPVLTNFGRDRPILADKELFSACSCHPCAGGMRTFSVSLQSYRMMSIEYSGQLWQIIRRIWNRCCSTCWPNWVKVGQVAPSYPKLPQVWPTSAEVGQMLPEDGPTLPAKHWRKLRKSRPYSPKIGQTLIMPSEANFGLIWSDFDRILPDPGRIWQKLAEVGPKSPKFGRNQPNNGRNNNIA